MSDIAAFRQAISEQQAALADRFQAGEPVEQLVHQQAAFIDELLGQVWRQHALPEAEGLALVAVGGYGRGELHPHSDIDLLLLGEESTFDSHGPALQDFLTFLWDLKLDIGHSVRTLEDCIEQAGADITVATNLMEARLLLGDETLYQRMREVTDQSHLWAGRAFFEAKWAEQIGRHRKYNDTAYNLEPNVKEGPGGLRDIQMVGWVAKRHFGVETLAELVDRGFLTDEEYHALDKGQNFLWKVRFGLHLVAGRHEDRLLFDHQRNLAQLFGYESDGKRLAVEYFMKEYYREVTELERLNEMLLQLFQEEILLADHPGEPRDINKRFQARRGFLEARDSQLFEQQPFALLELFLVMAQHPELKGVRAETIRRVRAALPHINEEFRADLRCRSLFMELLRQPLGVTHELRRMNRYGVLAAYLPEFGQIVGQMQHDLFHVYTVDEHTLRLLRNLRRLTVPEFAHEFPLSSRIIGELPKPELIYIAALYHDIAKGRGGDHSELGAVDAEAFCRRHDLSDYDTRLITWLVRNHLLMSTTAQRKDISDPEVINEFAQQVGDRNHLDYLYLLTVADVRATSPSVWNSWKDSLLAELYHTTARVLRRGLSNPLKQQELISETQQQAREKLHVYRLNDLNISKVWQRLDDDYFLRYSADEIAWHCRAILKHGEGNTEPLILVRQQTARGGTGIFIYTPIRGFQFSTTTAVLEQLGLNIVDARIIPSRDGYTLDSYNVLEEDGEPIHSSHRIQEIEQTLEEKLRQNHSEPATIERRMARQLKHFPIPTQVAFEEGSGNNRTIMEVVASDRPGLLSHIARAMADCNVRMQNAKIATLGERVEDIFFIVDSDNSPIRNENQLRCLQEKITEVLQG